MALVASPERTLADRIAVPLSCLVLTCSTAITIARASMVVDGTRYFWLDDDQMVAMRYARNLADGLGLVWNAGERVEGYTSLGWTLIMSAVHRLPLTDASTSLAVKIVALALACWVLVLADRLLRMFAALGGLARLAVVLTLALGADLIFWTANGFETPLVTVVFLIGLIHVLEDVERDTPRASTYFWIGALPIARSDAYYLVASLLVVAVLLHRNRTSLSRLAWFVCVLPTLQFGFRYAYYGDWLPNTYYLKVSGTPDLARRGAHYLKAFVEAYAAPLVVVAAAFGRNGDRRVRAIAVSAIFAAVYVLSVGNDMYQYFRFLAPWVPVLIVLAAATAHDLGHGDARITATLAALVLVVTTINVGVHSRESLWWMRSGNGLPRCALVAGLIVRDYTPPTTTIAVHAAGTAPYFSRRPALDLLGKTDAHIAHEPVRAPGRTAHGKFDYDYSLSRQPDLLLTSLPRDFPPPDPGVDPGAYTWALLRHPLFVDQYKNQPVPLEYLLDACTVYVRRSSPLLQTIDQWKMPRLSN